MHRRLTRRTLAGMLGAQIATGWASRAAAAESYTMRLSVPGPVTDSKTVMALRFASAVGRRSNGQIKVEVYPSGQLAREQESLDGLTTGTVDFTVQATAFLTQFFAQFQVLDAPFIFKDLAAASRVLRGPIGDELFALLDTRGILGLGWGSDGFRQIETTSKPIVVPDDMKGLRMRVQSGLVYPAMFQALGAIPAVIDVSEAFVALTQHTVDGIDIGLLSFTARKMYSVVKHIALTNHVLSVNPLLGSKRKIEALPLALQKIVKEEGKANSSYTQMYSSQQEATTIDFLKQNGVTFTEVQYAQFHKAMTPVYSLIQAAPGGGLLDRVLRAAGT